MILVTLLANTVHLGSIVVLKSQLQCHLSCM